MTIIYNFLIDIADFVVHQMNSLGLVSVLPTRNKKRLFIEGQENLRESIRKISSSSSQDCKVWVHASSLSEYEEVRPIVKNVKDLWNCDIIMTSYSPVGYNAITNTRGRYPEIDNVLSLPIDTKANADFFLETLRPIMAIFIGADLFINFMHKLKEDNIPSYLFAAEITRRAFAQKWHGGIFRKILKDFTKIMVWDNPPERTLRKLGIHNLMTIGNPLLEDVQRTSDQDYADPVIERFCDAHYVFAGVNISNHKDLNLICYLANHNRDTKFIVVPLEIYEERLNEIKYEMEGHSLLYSECDGSTNISDAQVLIIDYLVEPSKIYRYCKYAYVGGESTPYLHSVIGAIAYGIPVAFSSKTSRSNTLQEMIKMGIGKLVYTGADLNNWFQEIKHNDKKLEQICESAYMYAKSSLGTTDTIIQNICKK